MRLAQSLVNSLQFAVIGVLTVAEGTALRGDYSVFFCMSLTAFCASWPGVEYCLSFPYSFYRDCRSIFLFPPPSGAYAERLVMGGGGAVGLSVTGFK